MSKHHSSTKNKIPPAAILGAIVTITAALIAVFGPSVIEAVKSTPVSPSPIPACISAADILVTFHILKNDQLIAEPAAGDTIFLDPDMKVYFKAEIRSVTNSQLPEFECKWTNTGIATDGKLLHSAGCGMIDYQSGHAYIKDAVSMQLSQSACPALAPYPLFIMPK